MRNGLHSSAIVTFYIFPLAHTQIRVVARRADYSAATLGEISPRTKETASRVGFHDRVAGLSISSRRCRLMLQSNDSSGPTPVLNSWPNVRRSVERRPRVISRGISRGDTRCWYNIVGKDDGICETFPSKYARNSAHQASFRSPRLRV